MLKKILLSVIFLLFAIQLLPSASFSDPIPQEPTLKFYWVKGEITNPDKLAEGQDVYIMGYSFDPNNVVKAMYDPVLKTYMANVGELSFFHADLNPNDGIPNDNLLPVVDGHQLFFIAVVRTDTKTFGYFGVDQTVQEEGFVTHNITLADKEGPKENMGFVIGEVFETNKKDTDKIGNATVALTNMKQNLSYSVLSNSQNNIGAYSINEVVPDISYAVSCFANGYAKYSGDLLTPINRVTVFDIALDKATPIEILTNSLPDGTVGVEYKDAQGNTVILQAQGGKTPYTWSLNNGTLPQGLTLNGDGSITGTPTLFESQTVNFKVVDADGNVAYSNDITIIINQTGNGPTLKIIAYLEGFYEKGNPVTCKVEVREAINADNAAQNIDTVKIGECLVNVLANGEGISNTWSQVPIKLSADQDKKFYIILNKFNHLSVMLNNGIDAISADFQNVFDFTSNASLYKLPAAIAGPLVQKNKNGLKWMVRGGDANLDKKVELSDFNLLMQNWEKPLKENTDFNGDNNSELSDFNIIMNNWEIHSYVK